MNRGKTYLTTKEALPKDIRPIFDALVDDYEYYSVQHSGRPWVSFKILGDLALLGWRKTADAHDETLVENE